MMVKELAAVNIFNKEDSDVIFKTTV